MDEKNSRPDPEELKELLKHDEIPGGEPEKEEEQQTRGLNFLYDIPLHVSVEVGRSTIMLRDLLQMGEGFVIELDKLAGDPLELYVNSRLVAKGEAVMVGDKFGIRLTEVISTIDRLDQLT